MTGSSRPSDGPPAPFRVYVDDNSHYQDEGARVLDSAHADCAAATERCRAIVEASLRELHRAGMAADELLRAYRSFGADPWIAGGDGACAFSAWGYAAGRCAELCAGS